MDKIFTWLLLFAPAALVAEFLGASPLLVFFLSAAAIIPLAKFLGEATEELSSRTGPAFGGFLNATFGNATEVILGFFALRAGLVDVVKASITGSIVGNLLLVLGMAMLVGGVTHKKQKFNRTAALASSSMLFLAVIALVIPAIFIQSVPDANASANHELTILVAIFMLILYVANLIFIFYTHPHLYTEDIGKYEPKWSIRKSIWILLLTTVSIAWLSEILVGAIKPTISHLGWTQLFIGAVVVAVIGNAAEHTSAVLMAAKNRMDLSLQIAIGSATQIALFVVPLLIFISFAIGHPMNLVFNTFELIAIILSVMIANLAVEDGESNWLEGAQLLSAYAIIAVAFFLHP
jgi:Ca2+:H+ antiporter